MNSVKNPVKNQTGFSVYDVDCTVRLLCQPFIMGHNDERLSQAVAQVEEQAVKLFLVTGIQTPRRFICQHHCRPVDKGTCYCHPLLLSTRQFCRLVAGPLLQSQKLQHLQCLSACLACGYSLNQRRNHDIL